MIWDSEETAPKRFRISIIVSAISSSGTGRPSLNRSGSRISYRRCIMLVSRRPLYPEGNPLARKVWQRAIGYHQITARPRLERKTSGEPPKRAAFSFGIVKTYDDHLK